MLAVQWCVGASWCCTEVGVGRPVGEDGDVHKRQEERRRKQGGVAVLPSRAEREVNVF